MRPLKIAGLALMVFALASMWNHRSWVASAYTDDAEPIGFDGRGIDLSFEPAAIDGTSLELVRAPGTAGVVLPVFGSTDRAEEVTILGGGSSLTGTVQGPDGPVAGATVVIERFVGAKQAEVRVQTDEFGSWILKNAFGGAYRVRAFLPNIYVSPPSEVLFVSEGSSTVISTVLAAHTPSSSLSIVGGSETYIGADQTVAVVASTSIVDGEGRIVEVPIAGSPITAVVTGAGSLVSAGVVTTDSGGAARFRVRCDSTGTVSLRGTGDGISVSNVLSTCAVQPPPEPIVDPAAPVEEQAP